MGTPNELTDEDGNVVWLADYNAWGGVSDICKDFSYVPQTVGNVEITADELQPIRFQGQFYDTETGLHYNRFRYYDADVGMFISRDPIGLLGGNNVFQYAPNPIGWIDPFGLYEIALGINPQNMYLEYDLKKLQSINAYPDGMWKEAGITKVDIDKYTFTSHFDTVVKNADAIHFALNGLDPTLVKNAGLEFDVVDGVLKSGNVTNVELNKILNDNSLLDKTTFYLDNGKGFQPESKQSVISAFSKNCTDK